jgi:hypothetical protein
MGKRGFATHFPHIVTSAGHALIRRSMCEARTDGAFQEIGRDSLNYIR